MRPISLLSVLSLVACATEPESLGLQALAGEWRSPTEALQPTGTMDRSLQVGQDGRIQQQVITRGVYAGQPSGATSMQDVLYGRMYVRGDRYVIYPDSEVTEDVFYAPAPPSVRRDVSGIRVDSVHYSVVGDVLHREYLTYPADSPVLTQDVMFRVH